MAQVKSATPRIWFAVLLAAALLLVACNAKQTAVSAYSRGSYQEAATYFSRHLQENPTDAEALHGLGSSLLHMEQYEDAAWALLVALRLDPTNVDAARELALALYGAGDVLGAADVIELLPYLDAAGEYGVDGAYMVELALWLRLGEYRDRAWVELLLDGDLSRRPTVQGRVLVPLYRDTSSVPPADQYSMARYRLALTWRFIDILAAQGVDVVPFERMVTYHDLMGLSLDESPTPAQALVLARLAGAEYVLDWEMGSNSPTVDVKVTTRIMASDLPPPGSSSIMDVWDSELDAAMGTLPLQGGSMSEPSISLQDALLWDSDLERNAASDISLSEAPQVVSPAQEAGMLSDFYRVHPIADVRPLGLEGYGPQGGVDFREEPFDDFPSQPSRPQGQLDKAAGLGENTGVLLWTLDQLPPEQRQNFVRAFSLSVGSLVDSHVAVSSPGDAPAPWSVQGQPLVDYETWLGQAGWNVAGIVGNDPDKLHRVGSRQGGRACLGCILTWMEVPSEELVNELHLVGAGFGVTESPVAADTDMQNQDDVAVIQAPGVQLDGPAVLQGLDMAEDRLGAYVVCRSGGDCPPSAEEFRNLEPLRFPVELLDSQGFDTEQATQALEDAAQELYEGFKGMEGFNTESNGFAWNPFARALNFMARFDTAICAGMVCGQFRAPATQDAGHGSGGIESLRGDSCP